MSKASCIIIVLVSVMINASAQKLNLRQGTEFAYEITREQKGTWKHKMNFTYGFKVLKDSAEHYIIEGSMHSIKIEEPGYGNEPNRFDSKNLKDIDLKNSSHIDKLLSLILPFKFTLTSTGIITDTSDIKASAKEILKRWQIRKEIQEQCLHNLNYGFITEISHIFKHLSQKPIKYGSKWVSADSTTNYEVTGKKGSLLIVKATTGKTNNSLPQDFRSGQFVVNEATGLIESASLKSKGSIHNPYGKPHPIEVDFQQRLISNMKTSVHFDTAWIDMAVRSGFWSDALTTNTEFDSVKTLNFLREYDTKFSNDRYYLVKKLSLIQRFESENGYEWYDSILHKTPNSFLIGEPSHQFNKLRNALLQNADSAYILVKMLHKENHVRGWLQESYAQDFINFGQKTERLKSYQLLHKLNSDKDPSFSVYIHPLYLWVLSKDPAIAKNELIKISSEFLSMKDDMMTKGNAGRYAMLIYPLLKQSGEESRAQQLLDYTINRLEKFAKDTLNQAKYADKNLLAHAYYLKYLYTKPTDSAAAMKLLAKAADYSPGSEKEKAYGSFYDRVFLDSKESYRSDYLDALTTHGNKHAALGVFIQHINTNPQEIQNLQEFYEKKFNEKPFKQFFRENVISAWQEAPNFKLNSIEDKVVSLADYKGKWLVLDFWGTWCGPCKKEMPEINAFYKDVKAGKYPGVDFLSIACYDTKDKVISYFANNNYDLPGVISDNQIEKNYKVPHYPTKVIITPEGKMLMVGSENWKELIKQFSELYTAP